MEKTRIINIPCINYDYIYSRNVQSDLIRVIAALSAVCYWIVSFIRTNHCCKKHLGESTSRVVSKKNIFYLPNSYRGFAYGCRVHKKDSSTPLFCACYNNNCGFGLSYIITLIIDNILRLVIKTISKCISYK